VVGLFSIQCKISFSKSLLLAIGITTFGCWVAKLYCMYSCQTFHWCPVSECSDLVVLSCRKFFVTVHDAVPHNADMGFFSFRDKGRYRSRSRSHDGRRRTDRSRSQSYDRYDKYYSSSDKMSSKSRSKHSSRRLDDDRIRSKDRR